MNKKLIYALIGWQALIFCIAYIGISKLPIQSGYLGTDIKQYLSNPVFWFHSNFDGVHYIEIAKWGYRPLMYFFFPLYPNLIRITSTLLGNSEFYLSLSGQLVSLISFFVSFTYLYKLLRIDYKKGVTYLTLILILVFPTSFYFTAVYTESLFFALSILSLYFARKNRWFLSGLFGGLASLTRIIGIVLFISAFAEWLSFYKKEKRFRLSFIPLFLIPMGLLIYIVYLKVNTGDPLAFFHNLSIYGDQRSSHFVILPQVFYRYIFKVLPNSTSYLPIFATTVLEFLTGCLFLGFSVYAFFKMRLSYSLFLIAGYLIPTLTGSFSSLPRYALVLFPGFLALALFLNGRQKTLTYFVIITFFVALTLFTAMFAAGYWVS